MNKLLSSRFHGRVASAAICFAICSGVSGIASGQRVDFLEKIPGLTDLQLNVAVAVDTLCPPIAPIGNPNGTLTQRLAFTCTQMVVSAAANQGNQVPPGLDLNISNQQLARGLQAISPVQMNAQKQIAVEAGKMNIIGGRLLDLRGGARGFVVGSNGDTPDSKRLAGARGGAAGDAALAGRWGGFFNVAYSWGDVDQTSVQDAYDYDSYTLFAGADYRFSDNFVLGGALAYTDTKSDFNQSLGEVKAQTWSVAAYGTYYVDRWYIDGFVSYGSVDYDATRNIVLISNNPAAPSINASATASPEGDQWTAMLAVGRNFDYQTWTITPSLRLGYIRVKNDAFDESENINGLGLHVNERTIESLQTALGAKLSTVVNTAYGVFGPYFSASWVHEFENDNPSIFARYVNDPSGTQFFIPTAEPTRDYAALAVGSSAQFANNFSGFLQFGAALGLNDQTNYAVTLGIRKQF
jgi:outer membrane autotransporter protein